jgi:condensin complex subunit 3
MLLDPENLETLHAQIVEILQGAQNESSLHKRRVKALCKLHAQAATHVEKGKQPGHVKRVGEKKFNEAFWKAIANVLPVRKGLVEADRVIRLVGAFVQQLTTESGIWLLNPCSMKLTGHIGEDEDDDDDTPVDRFIEALVRRLIPGCSAKDKTVRYRTMQLLAELIKSVQSLPEEVYGTMHSTLINSANDKDATVRVQVVIVLGKLAHGEDLPAREGSVQSLTEILRNLMQFDPSPEVRRAALPGVHTQLNKQSLPLLLSRAKDPDANVRRTVFRVLKTTPVPARSLSLEQRTLVVRYGLGDRTPIVKAEASKLLASWVDGTKDLEEFISLFDLSSGTIAEDALGAVLAERPELLNDIDLSIGEKCLFFHQRQTH